MGLKSFLIGSNNNYKFDLSRLRNWDVIVENLALVVLNTQIRSYKNIDAAPKLKDGNKAKIVFSCLRQDGALDEYILNFDLLGCKDYDYDSEVSRVWRDCLEANFGQPYHDFVSEKLSGLEVNC